VSAELQDAELLYLEILVESLKRNGEIPARYDDPNDWDRAAFAHLNGLYSERSLMVQTLGDLLFVNAPEDWDV
jgi:hypothetical protein